MSVGKDPHRIQGKKGAEEWHRRASMMDERVTTDGGALEPDPQRLTKGDVADEDFQIGGSRPGVHSRVKDAIARTAEPGPEDEGS